MIRVKVPFEVALVLIGLALVAWIVIGMGWSLTTFERKAPRAARIMSLLVGLSAWAAALTFATAFYFEQDQHDAVYRGVEKFGLTDVALSAVLFGFGSFMLRWGRLPKLGAALAVVAGAALVAKPKFWPLLSYWPEQEPHPFSFTSETHLYFVLSGLGLLVLGVILLVVPKRFRPT